jgi:hypothetical protein
LRSTLAVTTALLLLLGIGVAEAADPTTLAQTAGFLLGRSHPCGASDESVAPARRVIHDLIAAAAIEGALQYPPTSAGEDAQPPPPARMVPQTVSPRRIELGTSGPSLPPSNYADRDRSRTGIDPFFVQPQSPRGATPLPSPNAAGN